MKLLTVILAGWIPPVSNINPEITQHIRHEECRMVLVGDSISNKNADNLTDPNSHSSIYWGIVRNWLPDTWSGIGIPVSNKFPAVKVFQETDSSANSNTRNRQCCDTHQNIFSFGYQEFTAWPTYDVQYLENSDNQRILSSELLDSSVWSKQNWFNSENMVAKIVYLNTPEIIENFEIQVRNEEGLMSSQNVTIDPASMISISEITVNLPHDSEIKLVTSDHYDETNKHFIWLTTHYQIPNTNGFHLDGWAVGGSKLRDHLSGGRIITDYYLQQYIDIYDPTLFYIQLGANDRTFDLTWKQDYINLIDRYQSMSQRDLYFILVTPYGTETSIQHDDANDAALFLYELSLEGTSLVDSSRIGFINLPRYIGGPIDSSYLKDTIHLNQAGSDYITQIAWSAITRCEADLTGSSDPLGSNYGIPDGNIDGEDFFYYLSIFNIQDSQADLTGSSDPMDPSYSVPNGTVDGNDFFYYLDLFNRGCDA